MKLEELAKGRKIVIYGVGNIGKEFAKKYSGIMSIYFCTSSIEFETPINGLKRVELCELNKAGYYLIICCGQYEEVRRNLIINGILFMILLIMRLHLI